MSAAAPGGPGTGGTPVSGPPPLVPEGSDGVSATEAGSNDPVVLTLLNTGAGVQVAAKDWRSKLPATRNLFMGIKLPTKIQVYIVRRCECNHNGSGFMPEPWLRSISIRPEYS